MDTIPLCISIFVLILLSSYFSATETAYSSLNIIRIKNLAAGGNSRAAAALALSKDFDRLLSTLLIGNNIVNILSASLATILFTKWIGDAGVSVSTVVMTVLVLVFGEISPKTIAKQMPERYAMWAAPSVRLVMTMLTPLNAVFAGWRKLLDRVFHFEDRAGLTEEEIITLVEEAESGGGLDQEQGELLRSAIEFNDLDVQEVLTARVDMVAVTEDASPEKVIDLYHESGHSRLLVYRGSLDTILGVIHEKDFFFQMVQGTVDLHQILKPVLFVSPQRKISSLLRELQQRKIHLAVIVDEFGGTMGMVTMEDILEELVGDIWDEHDEENVSFTPLPDGGWRIACQERLGELFEELALDGDPDSFDAVTVGGWVAEQLGHVPEVGDMFDYGRLRFEVTEMDHRRVLYVEARDIPAVV